MPNSERKNRILEHIKASPLIQWRASTVEITPQAIFDRAQLKGLSLKVPLAVNSYRFFLTRGNDIVKTGSLQALAAYLETAR